MLTIICGEDNIGSRKYFQNLKATFSQKNFEIRNIQARATSELNKWLIDSPSLFTTKKVFFTDNLMKVIKKSKNTLTEVEKISALKDTELYDWEDSLTARELKAIKGAVVREFKPTDSIFKLLDACYPSNKKQFVRLLNTLVESSDENFIFIMLARHIKNLLLIKDGQIPTGMQKWQAQKLITTTQYWEKDKLLMFYDGLYRIEIRNKTSTNPYSVKESLEILSCYFL